MFPFPISMVIHLLTLLGCDFFAPIADLPISTYRPESFDGFVKNKLPRKLFFFDHETVPLYRTHILCTQGRCNISLIGRTIVGSLSVFEWVDT